MVYRVHIAAFSILYIFYSCIQWKDKVEPKLLMLTLKQVHLNQIRKIHNFYKELVVISLTLRKRMIIYGV